MSNFDGDPSSLVTAFAADPTAESSALDVAAQPLEGLAFEEDDLAMFTNTHFFDFDLDETVNPAAAGSEADDRPASGVDSLAPPKPGCTGLDLLRGGHRASTSRREASILTGTAPRSRGLSSDGHHELPDALGRARLGASRTSARTSPTFRIRHAGHVVACRDDGRRGDADDGGPRIGHAAADGRQTQG